MSVHRPLSTFFFFGHAVRLARSQFPDQDRTWAPAVKVQIPNPLDGQGVPLTSLYV